MMIGAHLQESPTVTELRRVNVYLRNIAQTSSKVGTLIAQHILSSTESDATAKAAIDVLLTLKRTSDQLADRIQDMEVSNGER